MAILSCGSEKSHPLFMEWKKGGGDERSLNKLTESCFLPLLTRALFLFHNDCIQWIMGIIGFDIAPLKSHISVYCCPRSLKLTIRKYFSIQPSWPQKGHRLTLESLDCPQTWSLTIRMLKGLRFEKLWGCNHIRTVRFYAWFWSHWMGSRVSTRAIHWAVELTNKIFNFCLFRVYVNWNVPKNLCQSR